LGAACRCCNGRVVSVLEGGYNINGGVVSAFARSVEAHVRGLAEPHLQVGTAFQAQCGAQVVLWSFGRTARKGFCLRSRSTEAA
jgi:acetoin utilization deacetylase AcuC-like enzyme